MLGVGVNTLAVIIGSLIGLLFKRGIPKKVADAIMLGIGLCTLCIGISGIAAGGNILVSIISIVLGAVCGTLIDIDLRINNLAQAAAAKYKKKEHKEASQTSSASEGFIAASLLFCVGSMTIVGSLNAGISGNNEMLFTKSIMDFISSIMLSASLGIGVLVSSAFVFVFQGAIALSAGFLQPVLSEAIIMEINCMGSVLIIGLALNIIGIAKIKVANYLPALLFTPLIAMLFR